MSLRELDANLRQFRIELQDMALNVEQNWNDVLAAITDRMEQDQKLREAVKSIKASNLAVIDAKMVQLDYMIDPPASEPRHGE